MKQIIKEILSNQSYQIPQPVLIKKNSLGKINCAIFWPQAFIYIIISTFIAVCPYPIVSCPTLRFPQSNHKISQSKVAWYVLRVKNMHSGSPSDLQGQWGKAKLSNLHYIIRRGKAKLHVLKLTSVFYHPPSVGPKQLCALAHLGC